MLFPLELVRVQSIGGGKKLLSPPGAEESAFFLVSSGWSLAGKIPAEIPYALRSGCPWVSVQWLLAKLSFPIRLETLQGQWR